MNPSPDIQPLVAKAVEQAFDAWAAEHPALAAAIDRLSVTQTAVESLRRSPQFAAAIAAAGQARTELDLAQTLLALATPLVAGLLTR